MYLVVLEKPMKDFSFHMKKEEKVFFRFLGVFCFLFGGHYLSTFIDKNTILAPEQNSQKHQLLSYI